MCDRLVFRLLAIVASYACCVCAVGEWGTAPSDVPSGVGAEIRGGGNVTGGGGTEPSSGDGTPVAVQQNSLLLLVMIPFAGRFFLDYIAPCFRRLWTGHAADGSFPLPKGKKYHFFICHHQGSGGDQANILFSSLKGMGFKVWWDNGQAANERTLPGMKRGVRESVCLLIFLSGRKETAGQGDINGQYEGPFTRWFCHEEMATAQDNSLAFVGVMEQDERHGKADFDAEKQKDRRGLVVDECLRVVGAPENVHSHRGSKREETVYKT